jgi:AcrR family transcriptional regulator
MPAAKAKKPKPVAKAYHHGDLRHALLDAARIELAEVGREGMSLRSVARRAGVTHTAAYHHFQDKAELLATLAGDGFIALDEAMSLEMTSANPSAVEQLMACGRGYLNMASTDPAAYELMFNAADVKAKVAIPAGRIDPFQRLLQAVIAAREASHTTHSDAMTDAMMMWQVVHGCAMMSFSGVLQRRGLDVQKHGRDVISRLCQLFARRP